jgi:isopropylmalate/homocitrate/citramalate synthase
MSEPWKTDKWFTSPWNHLPDITKNYSFPKNIKIHDVTLRDGEQQTAVVFRREEKVAIAKKLDALGIHRIEAGMPAVSPQDRAAISDIAALGLKAEIFGFARCIPAEIKVIKDCGCTGVVIEIPASDHMIKYGYGWPVERAMKASIETTQAAKDAGLYTVFFTIDSTRTELNRFLDIVEQVATEGHMDALTMADTMGVTTPDAYSYAVRKVIARLKKPVEAHCHQDYGLGVANTIASLQAGASVAHTTITGLGERAGNVPVEDVVLSLLNLHNIDIGIKTEKFVETSKFVMDLAKVTQPPNRPIVGDKLYEVESGIIAGWVRLARKDHPRDLSQTAGLRARCLFVRWITSSRERRLYTAAPCERRRSPHPLSLIPAPSIRQPSWWNRIKRTG